MTAFSSSSQRSVAQRVALLLSAFVLAISVMQAALAVERAWPFTTDDAYITLRYARLLANGQGLRFNAGEAPVEGYSNFVSLLFGWACIKLGLDPVLGLKILGVSGFWASGACSFLLARRWLPPLPAAAPALWSSAYYGNAWWAVSGLETGCYQLIAIASVLLVLAALGYREHERPRARESTSGLAGAGALTALAGMIRPEGPLLAIVLLLALLLHFGAALRQGDASERGRALRLLATFTATFALPYSAYFAFRAAYFGRLLPNPVYCKAAFNGDSWVLLRDAWYDFWPLLVLASAASWRRQNPSLLVLFAVPLAYALLLHGVDPEVGYHSRHFLAAFPLVAVAAAIGIWNLTSFVPKLGELPRSIASVLFAALVGPSFSPDALREEAADYARRMQVRQDLADFLNQNVRSDDWIMLGDAGLIPYRMQAKVIDAYCLNAREMTEPPIEFSPERFVQAALRRKPKFVIVSSWDTERMRPQAYFGVWPALLKAPQFTERYRLVATRPTERFVVYSVFERGPP